MPDAVEIWSVDLAASTPALLALDDRHGIASDADRRKVGGLVDRHAAQRRLAATVALRLLLERRIGCAIQRRDFIMAAGGKPALPAGIAGPACHFSLAHSADIAAIAIAPVPVGIDIESRRTVSIDGRRRSIIEAAAATVSATPLPVGSEVRFLQAWCRLEALAKADGCGIGRLLTATGAVGSADGLPRSAMLAGLADRFACHDLVLPEVAAGALAAPHGTALATTAQLPRDLTGLEAMLAT